MGEQTVGEQLWVPAMTADTDYRFDRVRDAWHPATDVGRASDEGWDEYVERRAAAIERAIEGMRPPTTR